MKSRLRTYLFSVLLLIMCLLSGHNAMGQTPVLTIKVPNFKSHSTVKETLEDLAGKLNIGFSYNPINLKPDKKVAVYMENASVQDIITTILNDSTLLVKEVEGQVVIVRRQEFPDRNPIIAGIVKHQKTESPIPYATVYLKHSYIATVSDTMGFFHLAAPVNPDDDTLIISAMGYKTFVCPVHYFMTDNDVIVLLEDSIFLVDDVTVISYNLISSLFWKDKEDSNPRELLTFTTKDKANIDNYILFLNDEFGQSRIKKNLATWKKVQIRGYDNKWLNINLKYSPCDHCPLEDDFSVTLEILDVLRINQLKRREDEVFLTGHFQNLLNETFAQGVNMEQLEEIDGKVYQNKSLQPYTGDCYSFYSKGHKWMKGSYTNGLKDGEWEWWFLNGVMGKNVHFNYGKMHGKATYCYDNGTKKIETEYSHGEKNGLLNYWYPDGKIRIETTYKTDKLEGKYIFYHPNEKIAKEAEFENGIPVWTKEYNKRGKLVKAKRITDNNS